MNRRSHAFFCYCMSCPDARQSRSEPAHSFPAAVRLRGRRLEAIESRIAPSFLHFNQKRIVPDSRKRFIQTAEQRPFCVAAATLSDLRCTSYALRDAYDNLIPQHRFGFAMLLPKLPFVAAFCHEFCFLFLNLVDFSQWA